MLTPIDELDEINRALCLSSGWIALDLTNGNTLSRSSQSHTSQSGMYIFRVRNKMAITFWADSDQEAIHKANHDSSSGGYR